ncbi:immunoglobulin-like and fibronectin type III domain-containing protein 1 [Heterodontus francisci]|uniref:immunoglobulin-like and fibronectin type III domain-containing protein 1 n=1 Tax=Heterodontus francisci TaxID=7792 RepID=UPI00355AF5F3
MIKLSMRPKATVKNQKIQSKLVISNFKSKNTFNDWLHPPKKQSISAIKAYMQKFHYLYLFYYQLFMSKVVRGKNKKSSIPGVTIIEFTENIPQGCSGPDIERRPIPQTMQEGKSANFRAAVRGNPEPTVIWNFKEENLSNSNKYKIYYDRIMNEHILQIKQLATDDAGSYKCTVSNEYGEAKCTTNLNVIEDGFKKKLKRPGEVQDKNTDPVDFRKMLKKCAPPPVKKERKVPDNRIWEILMHADKKDYEKICMEYGLTDFRGLLTKLQQMKKQREEKQAKYVKEISNLKHVEAKPDGSASFGFDMELKYPGLKIYLYKDEKLIPHSLGKDKKHNLKHVGKRYTFCIKDLQPEDVGLYKVNVEDAPVFVTEMDISLIPVDFKHQLQDVQCKESQDGVFECTISLPLPVEWSYKKLSLENSDKYQIKVSPDGLTHCLIVKDVHPVDKGVYTISAGAGSSCAYLIVEKSPDTASPPSGNIKMDSERSQGDSLDINLKEELENANRDGLKVTTRSSLYDQDLITKGDLKGKGDSSSEDDSITFDRGGLLNSSTDRLDGATKIGCGGYDRMGKDGSGGLISVRKDGSAGLDGMGKDGKGRLDGLGKDRKGRLDGMGKDDMGELDRMSKDGKDRLDGMGKDDMGELDGMGKGGKGRLDGMGKDGKGRLDGMGKDGMGGLDGMGKGGKGRLDGMGKDGKDRLDGMGKDGIGRLDGMGRDGKGSLDGIGKDGSDRMDGSGINNLAGLDGSKGGGQNGLDTSGWTEMQNNLADGSNQYKDGLTGCSDSTDAGSGDKGQFCLNDITALSMSGNLSNMSGSDESAKGGYALSLGNEKDLLGEDEMSIQNESMARGKQDLLTSDASRRQQSGSARRIKGRLPGSDISELTADQKLKNKEPARRFKSGLSDVSARKGQAADLCCVMANQNAQGTWFKNGTKITSGDGKVVTKEGAVQKLTIPSVQEEDSGTYTFEADGGKTEASLFVEDPPEFDQDVLDQLGKKPILVKAGHTATVKVPFSGKPPVKVSWYKNGDELFEDSRISIDNSRTFTRLSISNCNRKDSGKMTIKLKNESGTTNANISLAVIDKPQAPQGPVEVLESSESCISFKWKPPKDDGGIPIEQYVIERQQVGRSTWTKVGEVDKSTTTFSFDKVELGKNYKFKVLAVNSEGISEALVSDAVTAGRKAVPGPPVKPNILNASSKSITLSWTPPHKTGSSRIIGYIIEKRKKGSNIWNAVTDSPVTGKKWTVTDVVEGLEYEFRVIAVNSSGPGEPSCETEAVFARELIKLPGAVRNLRVTDSTYSTISLAWTPPSNHGNDAAKGYIVEMKSSGSTTWTRCNTAAVGLTSYTVKDLKKMGMHFLRVRAINDGGMGVPIELDNYVLAMPPPVCPKFIMDGSVKGFMIIKEGNAIRVQMPFEASPPPEVIWLKDGFSLSKQATVTSSSDGTQLFIPVSQRSDSGIYSVTLKNLLGQESFSFEIRVTAVPKPPGPITLNENVPNTVTVSWEPSRDEPLDDHLYYVVMKNDSSRLKWHTVGDNIFNNKFTIINVVPGFKYYFRVLAKNDMGYSEASETREPWCISKQRDPITLNLPNYKALNNTRAPEFTVRLKSHIAPSGSDINMSCAVKGFPPPKVSWFKNNINIMDDANFWSTNVYGVCSLCIFGASPKETGEYTAIAENSVGRAISSARLLVRDSNATFG